MLEEVGTVWVYVHEGKQFVLIFSWYEVELRSVQEQELEYLSHFLEGNIKIITKPKSNADKGRQ